MAAGLSLREEDLDAFRHLLNEQAKLSTEDFVHRIWIDAPMPIGYVTPKLIGELERLAPFGQGFERPVFAEKGLRASDFRILGKNRNVLRMRLKEDRGVQLDAIIFGDAEKMMEEIRQAETIDVLYYPKINEYNGRRTIQIEIREYITH